LNCAGSGGKVLKKQGYAMANAPSEVSVATPTSERRPVTHDYRDTVRQSLSELEDKELLGRVQRGELTEKAMQIATEILTERGLTASASSSPSDVNALSQNRKGRESDSEFLRRCLNGQARLFEAYWVLGFGVWFAIFIPYLLISEVLDAGGSRSPVTAAGWVLVLLVFAFRDLCVWRCALNTKRVVWSVAARCLVVLGWGLVAVAALNLALR
jgi:hypothetical protein